MAVNNNLTDFLTNIAKKIRKISGTNGAINPQDFTNRMDSFEMIPTETITLDRQGKHSVLGYAEAEVALPTYTLTSGHIDFSSTDSATHHTIGATFKIPGTGYYTEGQGASNSISLPIYTLDPPSISYLNASTLRVSTSTIRPNGDTTSQHGYIKRGSSSKDYTLVAPDKPTISYNTTSHKFQVSQNITNHLIKTGNNSWGFNVTDITNFPYANLQKPSYSINWQSGIISLQSKADAVGWTNSTESGTYEVTLSSQILQRSDIEFSQSSGTSYYSITATTIIPTGGYYAKGTRASNTFNIVKRTLPELVVSETPNGYTVTSKIVQSGYYTANDSRTTTISTGSGETNLPTCTLKILSWSGERQNFRCYVQENGIIKKKAVTLNTVKYIGPGEKEPGETIVNNVVIGSTVYISYMFMKPITASPAIAIYDNTPSPSQYDSHAEMAIKQGTASGSNVSITIHG